MIGKYVEIGQELKHRSILAGGGHCLSNSDYKMTVFIG